MTQLDFNQTQLRQLADAVSKMNSSLDVTQFVTSNASTVHYPPPKPQFQLPENNSTKLVSIISTHIHCNVVFEVTINAVLFS